MAEKLNREAFAAKAIIHDEPVLVAPAVAITTVDRSFELPTELYLATVGLFLSYLGVMAFGFASPGLILPMAIFVLFVVAGFGVPALWVLMKPERAKSALGWSRFVREGIATATGRVDAQAAVVQVLILPALIFLWGVAVVSIAAIARG